MTFVNQYLLYVKRFLAKIIDFVFLLSFLMTISVILNIAIPIDSNYNIITIIIESLLIVSLIATIFGFSVTSQTIGRFCLGLKLTERNFSKPKFWSLFKRGAKYIWYILLPIRYASKKPEDNLIISQVKITSKSFLAVALLIIFSFSSFNLQYWMLPNIINRMALVKQIRAELSESDLDIKRILSIELLNDQLQMRIILMDNSCLNLDYRRDSSHWEFLTKTIIDCDNRNSYIKYEIKNENSHFSKKIGHYE
jgi:hypothetical protein